MRQTARRRLLTIRRYSVTAWGNRRPRTLNNKSSRFFSYAYTYTFVLSHIFDENGWNKSSDNDCTHKRKQHTCNSIICVYKYLQRKKKKKNDERIGNTKRVIERSRENCWPSCPLLHSIIIYTYEIYWRKELEENTAVSPNRIEEPE